MPTSGTPTFRPPRRKTVHPFKYKPRSPVRANQQARHQNSGRHDGKRRCGEISTPFDSSLDSGTSLTLWRLQVLFHSLSKVLFIFRSRYLCAIGLLMIFSLGRGIPAIRTSFPRSTTPKVQRCCFSSNQKTGLSPSMALHSRKTFPVC